MLLLNHELYPNEIEEIQGLWGPLIIEERLLQKIWSKQNFLKHKLLTESGKTLKILNPGKWNKLEGPDFKEAEIEIDGTKLYGDIEVHFNKDDWFGHNHDSDERFRRVVLHVVLFPPKNENPPPHTLNGYCPETLVLVKYLEQGLEEYALEDALLTLENRNHLEILESFLTLNPLDQERKLFDKARRRFEMKRSFAGLRLKTHGWEEACHQMLLEVLGYRRNKVPMSNLALKFPHKRMCEKKTSAEKLYSMYEQEWKLTGLRPANHPRKRLEQYINLINKNPDWMENWNTIIKSLGKLEHDLTTKEFRKKYNLSKLQELIKETVFNGEISGTRFHTILIDALLPLAGAYLKRDLSELWLHWFSGDIPLQISDFIKRTPLLDSKNQVHCNGLNQGVLQLFSEMCL